MFEPGTKFDQYQIVEFIASGGMALVFRARHLDTGETVALKVLSPHLTMKDEKFRERFAAEWFHQKQLKHAHILPVSEALAREGANLGIAMPFVSGPTLWEILSHERAGPLSAADMLALLKPVMDAVAYAHSRQVVHRDLKPANVIYDRPPGTDWPGHAYVVDFGLAKVLHANDGPTLTRTGTAMGSQPYMSPEQYRADAHIDARADVHALGMMAWEMLSGSLPFDPANRIAAGRYYTGQVPLVPPARMGLGVAPDLVALVQQACAIERDERTTSAKEFCTRFTKVAGKGHRHTAKAGAAVPTTPRNRPAADARQAVPTTNINVKPPRKRRTVGVIVGVGLALSLLVGVAFMVKAPEVARPEPLRVESPAPDPVKKAVASKPFVFVPPVEEVAPEDAKKPASPAAARPAPAPQGATTTSKAPVGDVGYLNIESDKDAIIYVGDRKMGTTPLKRVEVTPGNHRVLALDVETGARKSATRVVVRGQVRRIVFQFR